LSALGSAACLLVLAYLGAVAVVHLRGEVRVPFGRHAFFAPFNVLMYLASKVPRTPVLHAEDFPELAPLRDGWRIVRDEAVPLFEGDDPRSERVDLVFHSLLKGGWRRFHLKCYGDFLPSAKSKCPRTTELLGSIPSIRAAAFTVLPPGCEVPRHRDPLAGSLRYHLGLATPNSDRCRIWVDGQPHAWRDGEVLVFDETYVHWARNDTDTARIILFCDIERPLRTPLARAARRLMERTVASALRSQNGPQDPPGLANRLAPALYAVKRWRKRFKRQHSLAYLVSKHAMILLGLYLLLVRGLL
jgi:beta-hydroxylase